MRQHLNFPRLRSALRLVLLPALVAVSVSAHAGPFSSLFVFGDSLSDTGNLSLALPSFAPDPAQPYASGRFSDGPLWVETFADGLGLSIQANPVLGRAIPLLAGGNNYAFAGATTAGVLGQVAGVFPFYSRVSSLTYDPAGLYVLVAGGNDMRDARSNAALDDVGRQAAAQTAINNLSSAIALLANSGVRNVLISTLPDLGATPEAARLGLQTVSTDVTTRFNALVRSQLMFKGAFGDLNIELLDMAGVAARASTDLSGFNTTLPCDGFKYADGDVGFSGASCATSLFSDELHPSAFAHKLIGQAALAVYGVPLPGTLALMGLALFVMVGVQRRRQA
jgi:phospholipase/lecithinase/hemolysin